MPGASFDAVHSVKPSLIYPLLVTGGGSHSIAQILLPDRDTKPPSQHRHPRHPSLHAYGINRYSARPQIKPSGRDCMAAFHIDDCSHAGWHFWKTGKGCYYTSSHLMMDGTYQQPWERKMSWGLLLARRFRLRVRRSVCRCRRGLCRGCLVRSSFWRTFGRGCSLRRVCRNLGR